MFSEQGLRAITDFLGWYTYMKSGAPWDQYRGAYPDFPQTANGLQNFFEKRGHDVNLDEFKNIVVDSDFEPRDLITAISVMSPFQFMDMYEDPALAPALQEMAGNDPEGFYSRVQSAKERGDTAHLEAAMQPTMERFKQGVKQISLPELLLFLPGLGDSRTTGAAFSSMFRDFLAANADHVEFVTMFMDFAVGGVVEFIDGLADLMETHGDPETAQAWRGMVNRATSVEAQTVERPDIDYAYSHTPEVRNVMTDTFNGRAIGMSEQAIETFEMYGLTLERYANMKLTPFEREGLTTTHQLVEAMAIKYFDAHGNIENGQLMTEEDKRALGLYKSLNNVINVVYETNELELEIQRMPEEVRELARSHGM